MIRLTRIRSESAIHHNFYGEKKKEFEKELLLNQRCIQRRGTGKHDFKGKGKRWGQAKEQLFVETRGKCAYCEATTKTVSHGNVEHYRPKSIYWWLVYCYDNYLAACEICNQNFKGNHFPIQNQKMQGPTIYSNTTDDAIAKQAGMIAPDPLNETEVNKFIRLHQQEHPLLINPYFDDPAEYFAWRADNVLREVEITPNSENFQVQVVVNTENPEVEPIATASIEYYGLNRIELKNCRYNIYRHYRTHKQILESEQISPEDRSQIGHTIEGMKAPKAEFAGMIRYFDELFSITER